MSTIDLSIPRLLTSTEYERSENGKLTVKRIFHLIAIDSCMDGNGTKLLNHNDEFKGLSSNDQREFKNKDEALLKIDELLKANKK